MAVVETLTAATFSQDARRRLAREGVAMPDGSFPIRNRSDLRNAIRALGRARNPEAARVHIEHRARSLGLTGMLPGAWAVTAAFDPAQHPHLPGGSPEGGRWAPKGGHAYPEEGGRSPEHTHIPIPSNVHTLQQLEAYRQQLNVGREHLILPEDFSATPEQVHEFGVNERRSHPTALTHTKPNSYVVRYKTPAEFDTGAPLQEAAFHTPEEAEAYRKKIDAQYPGSEPYTYPSDKHVVMTASLVEAAPPIGLAPIVPPVEWFQDPELDAPTPLTVTADGRVYGHLAEFGKCHRGISGRCVFAPRSKSGYASFYAGGQMLLDDGSQIPVGRLTVNAHHAPLSATPSATAAHYDHSGTVAAFVRAGEDKHGIWVAGATRSDATPEQIRDLRANPPSGDWRNTEGRGLELVAALAVPVPGFPVMAVAASAYEGGPEQVTALILGMGFDEPLAVVAGAVDESPQALDAAGASFRTRALAARIRGGVDGLAELFR